jgi:hypothetical protein
MILPIVTSLILEEDRNGVPTTCIGEVVFVVSERTCTDALV